MTEGSDNTDGDDERLEPENEPLLEGQVVQNAEDPDDGDSDEIDHG